MIAPVTHTSIQIPTFQMEDLTLRTPRLSDLDIYAEFCASDRSKGVGGPYHRFEAEGRLMNIIGHWHLHGYGRWMVADTATDIPLGVVGLMTSEDWPAPEIAWTVFANAEGKSVAFRAATFARSYAYDVLGWSTVISCTVPDNTRSQALAKRMGAVHETDFEHETIGKMYVWRHLPPEALT